MILLITTINLVIILRMRKFFEQYIKCLKAAMLLRNKIFTTKSLILAQDER